MGAYALIAQSLLLRQFLVVMHGNEIAVGLFFVWWFCGIGIGAESAGRVVGRLRRTEATAAIGLAFGAILPVAMLIAMKTSFAASGEAAGVAPGWSRIFLFGAFASPVGFWVGAAFPFFAARAVGGAETVGRLFVWEALGGLLGGLLFTFVLAPYVSPFGAAITAAAVLLGGALEYQRVRWFRVAASAAIIVLLAGLALAVDQRIEQSLERIRFGGLSAGARFLFSLQTRYQNVTFAEAGGQTQIYSNGGYEDSFPDPYVYQQEAALLLAQQTQPRRVVLLGGGLTGLASAMLASPRVRRLDVVHLDDVMARRIWALLPPDERKRLSDPRVQLHFVDVRRFAKETAGGYDLAVVAAPDPSTALINRLYTLEFFREVRRLLGPGGVLALSLTGAENVMGEEVGPYLTSIYKTLRAVFPRVLVLPGDHVHLFATDDAAPRDNSPAAMKQRYANNFDGASPLPPAVIDQWVMPERIERFRRILDAAPSELNRDLHPVSYLAFLRVWDQFAGGGLARVLRVLVGAPRKAWLLLLVAACLLILLTPILGPRAGATGRYALASVATSGFVGMTVTVLAVLTYQSLFGQMYEKVALLVAGYMAGLALGGWWTTRRLPRVRSPRRLLVLGDVALAACGGLFLAYLSVAPGHGGMAAQWLLLALVALSGGCAGVAFPAAASILAARGVDLGRRAGRVDAVDHFAALAGSLAVGVVLLPVLGLPAVCLVWIAIKLACAVSAFVFFRESRGQH